MTELAYESVFALAVVLGTILIIVVMLCGIGMGLYLIRDMWNEWFKS